MEPAVVNHSKGFLSDAFTLIRLFHSFFRRLALCKLAEWRSGVHFPNEIFTCQQFETSRPVLQLLLCSLVSFYSRL